MSKSTYFSSKPVFGQLIFLIEDSLIKKEVKKCDSDRFIKRFTTKDHLISMLFCSLSKFTSFSEISWGYAGFISYNKYLNYISKRSALSYANKRKDV
ncbi:DUF4372 domain-containing protein [Gelidibacter sp.]|uniref:DUF4372 domain-containing protein n=1 Tax=Gelidibacter sp. TaxID=2018083 RepID=UPI003266AB11